MKRFSDDDIIRGILKRDNHVIQFIYDENFGKISQMILNNSGSDDDAEDAFQESLIILFKRLRENKDFELSSTFSTYIYSIARLYWLKKLRDTRKMNVTELKREMEEFLEFEEPPPVQDKDFRLAVYQRNLKLIPEDCQKILTLTAKDIPAKDIAEQLGFRSDSYVRKRRHFCKEFLVNRIKEDVEYQDLVED
ncbi:MAG: sigma-70 family RNA polymerase sigma factor [Bacteroidales bacterium]|jgi:RNA polymerase sigma factor (sigma-70 family)|nr:sigma-70 family RNA polymerase sigma factor [Bacteroidales bacterium]